MLFSLVEMSTPTDAGCSVPFMIQEGGGLSQYLYGQALQKVLRMDSEILWEILKFPNFEYYPAGCATLEYGAAF